MCISSRLEWVEDLEPLIIALVSTAFNVGLIVSLSHLTNFSLSADALSLFVI